MKRLMFIVALGSALATMPVAAAPRTQASISLNVPAQFTSVASATVYPRLGDAVTFTTTYPDGLNRYWMYINVLCYQGEDHILVFAQSGKPDSSFQLGGTNSPWRVNGGSATCVADLFYWSNGGKYTVLASTDFDVAG